MFELTKQMILSFLLYFGFSWVSAEWYLQDILRFLQQLSEDYENLGTRTKLALIDIQQLKELCVNECYSLWDNVIWNLLNSWKICLSIMVVLSESYLKNLERGAIELALTLGIAPKAFRWCFDDSHVQFGSRNNATEFLNVFNNQDPQIQYTIDYENDNKELNFLQVKLKNNLNHSYDFAVYRKPAIANVQMKPYSNICPNIAMGVFIWEYFIMRTAHLFRKMFSSRNKIFNKRFCRKRTYNYSSRKSHQRILWKTLLL